MIVFSEVTKKFGDNITVLENISFEIGKSSFAYLVGPTGSGKTTIFRLLIRDLSPTNGTVSIGDWDLTKIPDSKISTLRRKVGSIFQDLKLLMDRTVIENVLLPLQFTGISSEDARKKAQEAIIEVGLSGKEDQFPLQLSGGEKQRVAIARALVFEPDVILADEPTGNLDNETAKQIHELLKKINKKGTTIFMATHNDRFLGSDDRIIILEKGKIVSDKKNYVNKTSESAKAKFKEDSEKKKNDDKHKQGKKDKIKLEEISSKE